MITYGHAPTGGAAAGPGPGVGPKVWYQTILGEAGKPSMIMSLKCAHRWRVQRRRMRVIVPDQGLSDINGVLHGAEPSV